MNIGIVTYSLNTGGVETVMKSLAHHFSSKGYQVEFIETVSQGDASNNFQEEGFLVKTITINSYELRKNFAIRLAKDLEKFDVLLLNNVPFVHYLIGILKQETTVLPILHNDIDEFYRNIFINHGQWDKTICVSYALEEKFRKMKMVDTDQLITISNGVHVGASYPKQLQANNKQIKVLFVGRIEDRQKGVLLLPQIIKKVRNRTNVCIHLKVIGEGSSLSLLKMSTIASQLEEHITFLGSLEHDLVLNEMKSADILLMPSYYEGQGLVYLEAMAQGLIPIVSDLRNNTDLVINHKKNGFLCTIGDSDAFANEICYLIEDPQRMLSVSQEAWKTAYTSLSSTVMADKYIDLINHLKKNKKVIRSHKLIKIPYGVLPQFLFQSVDFIIRGFRKVLSH